MAKLTKINDIEFNRYPYRGIFTEIAVELYPKHPNKKSKRISIFRRYNNGDPKVTELVDKKIKIREANYNKARNQKPVYAEA